MTVKKSFLGIFDHQSVSKMASTLEQLKTFTTVVADTGDIQGKDHMF